MKQIGPHLDLFAGSAAGGLPSATSGSSALCDLVQMISLGLAAQRTGDADTLFLPARQSSAG